MAKRNPSMTIKAPALKDGKIKVELLHRDDRDIDILINHRLVACVYDSGAFHLVYQNAPIFDFNACVCDDGGIKHTN